MIMCSRAMLPLDNLIPDGVQLVTLVNSPGTGAGNGAANPAPAPPASSSAAAPAPTANPPANNNNNNNNNNNAGGGNATGFQAQNARDAQALNQQFASLTVGSACTVGQVACLSDGSFAQCPFGTFVATPCAGGTQCMALPLVNRVGTSVTCTTAEDAARRFEAAGVSGGATGRQAAAPAPAPAPAPTTPAAPPAGNNNNNNNNAGSGNATGFQAQNARNAQALNQQFASLTVGSACTVGQVACLSDGSFAQCPNGTFVSTPCAGGTQCIALPLVNSVGTSVTCTTLDDAARRFEAAGVSGGFNGSQ
ncbi:hypothetical protein FRC15_007050 [Serendipita sp. 397]|nr:hypothetical protein FRC15_007050 [Serendipita sp. 397]